mgnify:CR=1 FL=1
MPLKGRVPRTRFGHRAVFSRFAITLELLLKERPRAGRQAA